MGRNPFDGHSPEHGGMFVERAQFKRVPSSLAHLTEKLINLDPHAGLQAEHDIYVEVVLPDGSTVSALKWRKGEWVTAEEAQILGHRQPTEVEVLRDAQEEVAAEDAGEA